MSQRHHRRPTRAGGQAGHADASARRTSSGSTTLFDEVIAKARVFQGGGNELTTGSLRDGVETAANHALVRLFPKFAHRGRSNVEQGHHQGPRRRPRRARRGRLARRADGEPGLQGGARPHLRFRNARAATSSATSATHPFGWPKDAVNGAVLTLLASGNIRAAQDGSQ